MRQGRTSFLRDYRHAWCIRPLSDTGRTAGSRTYVRTTPREGSISSQISQMRCRQMQGTVANTSKTSCLRSTGDHHSCFLQVTAKFFMIDILGPPPKSSNGIHLKLLITDCYSKITRAVRTSNTTVANNVSMVMNHWIIVYGIPSHFLTVK